MIDYREEPQTNIAEITIDGPISRQAYDDVCAQLVALIERKGRVRLLEHIRDIGKFDLSIIPADIAFSFHHIKDISHCAIVSDAAGLDWLAKVLDPLFTCKVRYFEEEDLDMARHWVRTDAG